MEFYREIINTDKINKIFNLPDFFKHRKVEMILLPILDNKSKITNKFDPNKFRGSLNLKNSQKEIEKIRNEWES